MQSRSSDTSRSSNKSGKYVVTEIAVYLAGIRSLFISLHLFCVSVSMYGGLFSHTFISFECLS